MALVHSRNAMSAAQRICRKANDIGLFVRYDRITPADGNCFYHAVLEGLQHILHDYRGSHFSLRKEVVQFVLDNQERGFVTAWLAQNPGFNITHIANRQRFFGVFGNELFIRATAMYLNIAIVFTKATSTHDFRYDVFGQLRLYCRTRVW